MKTVLFALILSSVVNANAPDSASTPMKPKLTPVRYFVGCRPSAGECKNSCAERNGKAELDARLCDPTSLAERYACYCPVRSSH